MDKVGDFEPAKWIERQHDGASVVLAGSIGPPMSLNDLKEISTDREATERALQFDNYKLAELYPEVDEELGKRIASLYDQDKVSVTPGDVIIANATTGANLLAFQALLSPGDHVISAYPAYAGLPDVPKIIGAEVEYIRMDPDNEWKLDVGELESMLKPTTKMLILNSPHNPTGTVLSPTEQEGITQLAAKHGIIVFVDEIFRPLLHKGDDPMSMLEHPSYDRIVVTGSLSKCWGFPGVRIGWAVTRNRELREKLGHAREYVYMDVSLTDKIIAKEVLSERCRDKILWGNMEYARQNIITLEKFVESNKHSVSCTIPAGGSTAFVKFSRSGQPIDDLAFCHRLKKDTGVLLSPGSLCFGLVAEGDFKGYVRVHITVPPEKFREGIEKIETFLMSEAFESLSL